MAGASWAKNRFARAKKQETGKKKKSLLAKTYKNPGSAPKKKTVEFADKTEKKVADSIPEEAKKGGAIADPTAVPVAVDNRFMDQDYTETLQDRIMHGEDYDSEDEYTDEEVGAFSHYGGSLSGRGAAYDHPETARAVLRTLQGYPEAMSTYLSGSVPNRKVRVPHLTDNAHREAGRGSGASIVDYGGSLGGLSHSVNGYLSSHDSSFPHEFHIYDRGY